MRHSFRESRQMPADGRLARLRHRRPARRGPRVAAVGGARARRGAGLGVCAIGLASAVTNMAVKPSVGRRRPLPSTSRVPDSRRFRRPVSASFPSGHTASAFAFASAVGEAVPVSWVPLHAAAVLVGYSRVHTGVHYPSDVVAGAILGTALGLVVPL